MLRRLHRVRTNDEGVALIMAIALIGLVGMILVTLVAISIREGRQTSNNRSRATAVTTAEGAVDLTMATVQAQAVGTLPCGGTTSNAQSVPDSIAIVTTITYVNATGIVLACPPPSNQIATQVLIRATSTSTPPGGGLAVKRSVETLAALTPKFTNDLTDAIFGNAGVTVGNNFDLYGQSGPDADIYTNGNFSCAGNEHFRGSVFAPVGSITVNGPCVIDVDAKARDTVTLFGGSVGGNVSSSAGAVNGNGSVGGKAYTTVASSSYCTANPTKCVIGPVAGMAPQTFPVLNGDDATIQLYKDQGYAEVDANSCGAGNIADPAWWLLNQAQTATTKVVLRTTCRVSFAPSAKTVSLNNDIAIFADRGISLTNSIGFQSTVAGAAHQIFFIHPADFHTRVPDTCASLVTGISLSNLVNMTSDIRELLYSPCNIDKANNSTIYGQVYGGGTVTIANKTSAYYKPLSVIGVTASNTVQFYKADVLYKRETIG